MTNPWQTLAEEGEHLVRRWNMAVIIANHDVTESEYDYAEDEDYLYADGDYDGAYYYDEEYNAG